MIELQHQRRELNATSTIANNCNKYKRTMAIISQLCFFKCMRLEHEDRNCAAGNKKAFRLQNIMVISFPRFIHLYQLDTPDTITIENNLEILKHMMFFCFAIIIMICKLSRVHVELAIVSRKPSSNHNAASVKQTRTHTHIQNASVICRSCNMAYLATVNCIECKTISLKKTWVIVGIII